LEVLKATRDRIDLRLLRKQPGYLEARDRKRDKPEGNGGLVTSDADQTPEELMEQSFEALRESLGRELLVKLKSSSPAYVIALDHSGAASFEPPIDSRTPFHLCSGNLALGIDSGAKLSFKPIQNTRPP
jgi:hypothetical protein